LNDEIDVLRYDFDVLFNQILILTLHFSNALKEFVHAFQILGLVMREHGARPGILHGDEGVAVLHLVIF